uniref:NADH-ubiquinone oxidoreductase chain 3 n=1 Tax=Mesenchytraeus cf. gelidus SL-2017 TaxID=2052679 RepID=A0A286KAV2_9ANNE|nr:NADH dehydrogenase subunit 3 [Mesenchytraeus cf. gelidus SL-2017]
MNLLLMSSMVAIVIPFILFILSWVLSVRTLNDREKSSPFECGFDPNHSARVPFSMRFFLLAIIFIVFDIEIVLLVPIPLILFSTNVTFLLIGSIMFLVILILGLLHEWNEGSLEWAT